MWVKMATGGVPAVSEALRMVPEKITALIDAQVLITASILSGRPDLALGRVVALYRDRVSDNSAEERPKSFEVQFHKGDYANDTAIGITPKRRAARPLWGVPNCRR